MCVCDHAREAFSVARGDVRFVRAVMCARIITHGERARLIVWTHLCLE